MAIPDIEIKFNKTGFEKATLPWAEVKLPYSAFGIDKNSAHYKNMTDKEIYGKMKKLYDPLIRFISVDLPAKASCRPPETIKKDIKHEKNPMRLKQLNQELNKSYKIYRTRRK